MCYRGGPCPHDIGFALQTGIAVYCRTICRSAIGLHSVLHLLDEVPAFVRQMGLGSRTKMNFAPASESVGFHFCRLGRIVVNLHVRERNSRQHPDPMLQTLREVATGCHS